jgi:hypothetical protein
MECKKYGNDIKLNKSMCQCSDGYLADSDRLCSKYNIIYTNFLSNLLAFA